MENEFRGAKFFVAFAGEAVRRDAKADGWGVAEWFGSVGVGWRRISFPERMMQQGLH